MNTDQVMSAREWAKTMIPPSGAGEVIAMNIPIAVAFEYMKLHGLEVEAYVNGNLTVRPKRSAMLEMAEELAQIGE